MRSAGRAFQPVPWSLPNGQLPAMPDHRANYHRPVFDVGNAAH